MANMIDDLIYLLRRGEFDQAIDEILELAQWRTKLLAGRITEKLSPGDYVRIKERAQPECLSNAMAVVISVKREVVVVELQDERGKYEKYARLDIPATLVTAV